MPESMGHEASLLHPNTLDGKITDYYFTPKAFESEKLYQMLGVGVFKKYMPHGDWVMRRIQKKAPQFSLIGQGSSSGNREDRPRSFEQFTRRLEGIHLGALALFGAFQIRDGDYTSGPGKAISSTALQIGINVYPIMIQRLNRLRTNRILERADNNTNPNKSRS